MRVIGNTSGGVAIIPHGVDAELVQLPHKQRGIESYFTAGPFRIIYVSIVDQYKHQWELRTRSRCFVTGGCR